LANKLDYLTDDLTFVDSSTEENRKIALGIFFYKDSLLKKHESLRRGVSETLADKAEYE
jgi:hypothetical protein